MREQGIRVTVVEFGDRPHYQMQWRDPATGKKKTKSTGIVRDRGKRSRKEAERIAAVYQAELSAGRVVPGDVTWAELKRRYLAESRNRKGTALAASTRDKVQTVFAAVDRILSPNKARELTAEAVSRWLATLGEENLTAAPEGDDPPGEPTHRTANTVAIYARHLKSVLRWAADMRLLAQAPKIRIATPETTMKDRPIVREEYERMREAVAKVVPAEFVAGWQTFLDGLWWSGLRLGEALRLAWDSSAAVAIVMQPGYRPAIRFRPEGHKAGRDELAPCAPEFAEMLERVPEADRVGLVFRLGQGSDAMLTVERASRLVSKIGEAARVIVDPARGKPASAHSFRRAFGTRWAKLVMPATLKRLMRHKNIETTLKHYVDADAEEVAADLWAAYNRESGRQPAASNKPGNSGENRPLQRLEQATQTLVPKRLAK